MRVLKRSLLLAVVTALSLFAWALPAQAGTVAVDCAIEGHADAKVLLLGGTGTYGFTEFTATCAGGTSGKGGNAAVVTLNITSNGTFTNTVCGTGEATDTDPTVVAATVEGSADLAAKINITNLAYTVSFSAGVGVLQFTDPDVTGGGVIGLSPADAKGTPSCVNGFDVHGDVAGTITV